MEMPDRPRPAPNSGSEPDPPITAQHESPAQIDAALKSIGEELGNERQRSGKTLMDVSLALKIPPHHLIAIENSAFEALPGRPYAIGFVRSYAAYLGLDAQTFVARLRAEMGGPDVKLPLGGHLVLPAGEDQPGAAPIDKDNGREPEIALSSALARTALLFSPPKRSVPLPSPPHPRLRQWVVAGLM